MEPTGYCAHEKRNPVNPLDASWMVFLRSGWIHKGGEIARYSLPKHAQRKGCENKQMNDVEILKPGFIINLLTLISKGELR